MSARFLSSNKAPYTIEPPFEIPESWVWVRLGDLFEITSSKRVHQSEWKSKGIPFYRAREIVSLKKSEVLKAPIFIDEKTYDKNIKISGKPEIGDILVTGVGTLGEYFLVNDNKPFYFKDGNVVWFKNHYKLDVSYICKFMDSPLFIETIYSASQGTTVGTFTIINAKNTLIPFPPLSEQYRIVQKIEELLPLVEHYDQTEQKLTKLNDTFPEQLKKSVLQAAIQGKLTEQLPTDEPASELLKRIETEKMRLISEGKLKKPKLRDNSQNTKFELPFEIPTGWEWVKLEQLGEIIGGGTPSTTNAENWENGSIPWLTPADMKFISGKYVSNGERKITEKGLNSSSAKILPENSIIYSSRAPIGYIAITQNKLCTNQGFKSINLYEKGIADYLYYALISLTPEIQSRASGTTFKEISGSEFGKTLIPLPSLEEQKRIVEKVELLLSQIERF